jgi:hypothetical protein
MAHCRMPRIVVRSTVVAVGLRPRAAAISLALMGLALAVGMSMVGRATAPSRLGAGHAGGAPITEAFTIGDFALPASTLIEPVQSDVTRSNPVRFGWVGLVVLAGAAGLMALLWRRSGLLTACTLVVLQLGGRPVSTRAPPVSIG